jgi:hypothetical protein
MAVTTAINTVRGNAANLPPGLAKAAADNAKAAKEGPLRGAQVNKVDHKQFQGKAVFAVTVDGVEVDVDRVTGQVVNTQAAQ